MLHVTSRSNEGQKKQQLKQDATEQKQGAAAQRQLLQERQLL